METPKDAQKKTPRKSKHSTYWCRLIMAVSLFVSLCIGGYTLWSFSRFKRETESAQRIFLQKCETAILRTINQTPLPNTRLQENHDLTDPIVVTYFSSVDTTNNPDTLSEAVSLLQGQFSSFKSETLAMFGTFAALVLAITVAVPLISYITILRDTIDEFEKKTNEFTLSEEKLHTEFTKTQKDIFDKFQEKSDDSLEKIKNSEASALVSLDKKYESLCDEINQLKESIEKDTRTITDQLIGDKKRADPSKRAFELAMEGNRAFSRKDYRKASDLYEKAIQLDPKNAFYHHSLGVTFHKMGRYEKSLEEIRKATQLAPEDAFYHDTLSIILNVLKHYKDALEESRKAIELEPENSTSRINYAYTLYFLGHDAQALQEAEKAFEMEKTATTYNLYAALLFFDSKRTNVPPSPVILEYMNQSIELDSERSSYYSRRAEYYLYTGEDEKAYADLQKALELNPHSEYTWFYLGKYYDRKGEREEARKAFLKATEEGYTPRPFEEQDEGAQFPPWLTEQEV